MPRMVNFKNPRGGRLWRPPQAGGGGGGGGGEYATPLISARSGGGNFGSINYHLGWQFTVGASDLEADGLRVWSEYMEWEPPTPDGFLETLYLWRVSDQALLGSVEVGRTNGAWSQGAIAPVTLEAGQDYIVSCWGNGGDRHIPYDVTCTFHSGITQVGGRKPDTSNSADYPASSYYERTGLADVLVAP